MLKAIIARDIFEALPKEIQAEYVEFDKLPKEVQEGHQAAAGKFVLSVESVDGFALENVVGLKSGLAKERQERAALKAMVEKFGDLNPDQARDAIEKVKGMADWTPNEKAKAQLEHTVQQLNEKYKAELDKERGEKESYFKQLRRALIHSQATQALAEHKGDVELLLPHVIENCDMRPGPNGEFVARVLNPDRASERITMKAGSQDPMSISEYVGTDMKKRFPNAFGGTRATGSGAEGGPRGNGGGPNPGQLSEQDARDPLKYKAAREAALKAGRPAESILPQRAT